MCRPISTCSVNDLVNALGTSGVSKSQVSRLCGELDERVGAFLGRAKVREHGRNGGRPA